MKLKAFGIFCLSFLVMSALSSCDDENPVNEEGSDYSNENPTVTVLAEQMAGNDGYDEKGVSVVDCPSSQDLHSIYSGLKLNFQLPGITKIELESVDGYALSGTVGIPFWSSMLLTKMVSFQEKITMYLLCLVISTEAIGYPSIARDSWHIISVYIRLWNLEHSSVQTA